MKRVLIVLGSDSDLGEVQVTAKTLAEFGVESETRIASAHRSPEHTATLIGGASKAGVGVVIAAAGLSAHLAGACAAHTTLPVIAIPLERSPLGGQDALFASAMMPGGVPVATVAIGAPGAKNAALLAVRILALGDAALAEKLLDYRNRLRDTVLAKDKANLESSRA